MSSYFDAENPVKTETEELIGISSNNRNIPDIRVVMVPEVIFPEGSEGFKLVDYLRRSTRGYQTVEEHDEFLRYVFEPFSNTEKLKLGFWCVEEVGKMPLNLIEMYSYIFTNCFGDNGRDLVTSPSAVRDVFERIFINGENYIDHYKLSPVNKMNYYEMVCEFIENVTRGEVADSFLSKEQEHMVVTYMPPGKDYVNVYIPAASEASVNPEKMVI